ncbi:MAG: hypothetical protein KBB11_05880 [Bacteroidales bacterium]|nr:hypothetical protein [Bacteroidales bacterium]HOY37919.1 hypothetical protein [Bacteroidales bacterium]
MKEVNQTGCCPPFDPKPWNNNTHHWNNKRFVKDHVITEHWVPVNFGEVVQRIMEKMDAAGAQSPGWMGLSDHTSEKNMDIYVESDREVPGIENVSISATIFSKVYDGSFDKTQLWCDDFNKEAQKRGFQIKKSYMWYTTCPKCAEAYGNNVMQVGVCRPVLRLRQGYYAYLRLWAGYF